MTEKRMKELLQNAIFALEDYVGDVMGTDLEDAVGITEEEYDEIID